MFRRYTTLRQKKAAELLKMNQSLTPEVRQIIERVLQLEKDRLDRKKNSPINDDILQIIKEIVK